MIVTILPKIACEPQKFERSAIPDSFSSRRRRGLSSIPANETAVFETREPEPIPIRRIPGLRNAIEPLNRIIRIRADAAGGFDDGACAPNHSMAFLHGFPTVTQTCQRMTCGGPKVHYTF